MNQKDQETLQARGNASQAAQRFFPHGLPEVPQVGAPRMWATLDKCLSLLKEDSWESFLEIQGVANILDKLAIADNTVPIVDLVAQRVDAVLATKGLLESGISTIAQMLYPELAARGEAGSGFEALVKFIEARLKGQVEYEPASGTLLSAVANKTVALVKDEINIAIGDAFKSFPNPILLKAAFNVAARNVCSLPTPKETLTLLVESFSLPSVSELKAALPPNGDRVTLNSLDGPWEAIKAAFAPVLDDYGVNDYGRELMFRWVVGMTARAVKPGTSMPWALLLQGAGGNGKTVWGQLLAIPGYPAVEIPADQVHQDKYRALLIGSSVCILDELDEKIGSRQNSLSRAKDFLTMQSFKTRLAYREDSAVFPVSYAVLATQNGDNFTESDGAEMRRWGFVHVPGGRADGVRRHDLLLANRDKMLACAHLAKEAGYPFTRLEVEGPSPAELAVLEPPEYATLRGLLPTIQTLITEDGQYTGLSTENFWVLVSENKYQPRKGTKVVEILREQGWTQLVTKARRRIWQPPGAEALTPNLVHVDALQGIKAMLARYEIADPQEETNDPDPQEKTNDPEGLGGLQEQRGNGGASQPTNNPTLPRLSQGLPEGGRVVVPT